MFTHVECPRALTRTSVKLTSDSGGIAHCPSHAHAL